MQDLRRSAIVGKEVAIINLGATRCNDALDR